MLSFPTLKSDVEVVEFVVFRINFWKCSVLSLQMQDETYTVKVHTDNKFIKVSSGRK